MLQELGAKEKCLGCGACVCEEVAGLQPHGHRHGDFLHVGEEGCQNYVPVMTFNGYARAYIPKQKLCCIYRADVGFVCGTIFPELDHPYMPRRGGECFA
jgi:hypothetical protein